MVKNVFFFFLLSVIIARILRKSTRRMKENDVYKIEIKKAYKVRETVLTLLCFVWEEILIAF